MEGKKKDFWLKHVTFSYFFEAVMCIYNSLSIENIYRDREETENIEKI